MKRGLQEVKNEINLLVRSLKGLEKKRANDSKVIEVQKAIIGICKEQLLHTQDSPTIFNKKTLNDSMKIQSENVEKYMIHKVKIVNALRSKPVFDDGVIRRLLTSQPLLTDQRRLNQILKMNPSYNTLRVCVNLLLYKYKDLEALFEVIENNEGILKERSKMRLKRSVLYDFIGLGVFNLCATWCLQLSSLLLADLYLINALLLKNLYPGKASDVRWRPGLNITHKIINSEKMKIIEKINTVSSECYYPNVNNYDIKSSPLLQSFTQDESIQTTITRKLREYGMIAGPSKTEMLYHDYWQNEGEFDWVEHDKDPVHFIKI